MLPGYQISTEDFTFLSAPEPVAPQSGNYFHCMSDLGYGIRDNDYILVDPDREPRSGSLLAILTTAGVEAATYAKDDQSELGEPGYFCTKDSMIPCNGSVLVLGVIIGLYREFE